MRRVVSVWLPDWPVTAWRRRRREGSRPPGRDPFILVAAGPRGQELAGVNASARALGLRLGQAHADSCAMAPGIASAPCEADDDRQSLHTLALWAERFSPIVAMDASEPGMEGLFIDMTGGTHLFGGEAALLAGLHRRLAAASIPAQVSIAGTPGAAWAMARFSGRAQCVVRPEDTEAALAPLPVQALRLQPDALRLLRRLGIRRIGELAALPRAGLARRLAPALARLDQAMGHAPEPLIPVRPAAAYRVVRSFLEPLIHMDGVDHQLPAMADALCEQLEHAARGARRVVLAGFRVDGGWTAVEAILSAASATPAHLVRLLRDAGLERLDLGFGADALVLEAPVTEPLLPRQREIGQAGEASGPDGLAALIDRLRARLGERAVRRPALRDSWIPERSESWIEAGPAPPPAATPMDRLRPILLLDPPERIEALAELPDRPPARFVWRRAPHHVVRAEGPERLSPEWWQDAGLPPGRRPRTRDYFTIEDEHGRRFWLFRDGMYTEDARPPEWWMHGVLA